MNSVALVGNLATDVDVRELDGGKKVASFLLAVDRRSADGGADFLRVAAWEKQAETCSRYLAKGSHVAVEGRLRSSSWEDGDGRRRRDVEVVARYVEFLSARAAADAEAPFEAATVPA